MLHRGQRGCTADCPRLPLLSANHDHPSASAGVHFLAVAPSDPIEVALPPLLPQGPCTVVIGRSSCQLLSSDSHSLFLAWIPSPRVPCSPTHVGPGPAQRRGDWGCDWSHCALLHHQLRPDVSLEHRRFLALFSPPAVEASGRPLKGSSKC